VESVGCADALEEAQERARRFRRNYKIQESSSAASHAGAGGQEERGSKGGAHDLPLPRRPLFGADANTGAWRRHQRKITSGEDRNRLKEIAGELEVPKAWRDLRTAAPAAQVEVKRDFDICCGCGRPCAI